MAVLQLSFLLLQMMPPCLATAIATVGWRRTYVCMAGVMAVLLLAGRLLLRDTITVLPPPLHASEARQCEGSFVKHERVSLSV